MGSAAGPNGSVSYTHLDVYKRQGYTRLIIDAVIENLGVSLLPRFTLEEALREKKIALFSVKGFRSSMLMQVIYSKNRWVSPAMKAFIEMTKEFMPE